MNETYNLKAIILKREPFRENDLKVTLYSPEKGKLALIARGAKKLRSKMAGHLEPFCFSEIMAIRGRQLEYAGSAMNINCFRGIKEDLNKLKAAGNAFKIFGRLVKEAAPEPRIFNLLLDFLNALDKEKNFQPDLFANLFLFKLLAELGYKPELHSCVVCRKKIEPEGNWMDFNKGGLVCPKCLFAQPAGQAVLSGLRVITEDCIKIFRISCEKNLSSLSALKVGSLLKDEISGIVGFSLKSLF